MYGWIVRLMIARGVRRLNAGDIGPLLSGYSKEAVLVFPGDHSWGGEYKGRDRIEEFLRRCVRVGLKFQIEDVVVSGWPWNAKVCIRLADSVCETDGRVVYANRAVIFAKTAWGKIYFQEDYEDTQRVVEFDKYIAAQELTGV